MKMDEQRVLTEEEKTDTYVRKKMMEAADAREAELNADHSLDFIRLTDEMRADMQRRIEKIDAARAAADDAAPGVPADTAADSTSGVPADTAADGTSGVPADIVADGTSGKSDAPNVLDLLSEEDRRALELGKKAMRLHRHRKAFRAAGIAAVIGLGIFGISMTSEANRLWWADLWDRLVGSETVSFLENGEEKGQLDTKIWEICAEIKEKTDINAIYFEFMPDDLAFDEYMITEELGTATMIYKYQEETYVLVRMLKKKNNSVTGQIKDGDVLDKIPVETDFGTVEIRTQAAPNEEKNYSVEFIQDDCQYSIFGVMPEEEFVELIKNILFF